MNQSSRIYVAGHRGLVGSAIVRALRFRGFGEIIERTHAQLDLMDQLAVDRFFAQEKPEFVFLAAAKVGGIYANNAYPAEFAYSNLEIQNNIVNSSWKHGVIKLCFLGSACIYPKMSPQPIKEEYFMTGRLEPTNEPYAIAKIAGIIMCQSYNRQYGADFISVMPTNLYGINDNYHPENSHVLPALIRKFHEAKAAGAPAVTLWGTGAATREFMCADDCADACVFLMQNYRGSDIINIGTGQDVAIRDLAAIVKAVVGYTGSLEYDASKPDGMPRRRLDSTKLFAMGWRPKIDLREGIRLAYEDFLRRYGG
jgi:GDP-L-fucose synthase